MGQSPAGLFGYSPPARRLSRRPGRVPARALRRRAPSRSRTACRTRRSSSSPTSSRPATWPRRTPRSSRATRSRCGAAGRWASSPSERLDVGAGRVIAIDRVPERLEMARKHGKAETINFDEGDGLRPAAGDDQGARPGPLHRRGRLRGPRRGSLDAVLDKAKTIGRARHRPGARRSARRSCAAARRDDLGARRLRRLPRQDAVRRRS